MKQQTSFSFRTIDVNRRGVFFPLLALCIMIIVIAHGSVANAETYELYEFGFEKSGNYKWYNDYNILDEYPYAEEVKLPSDSRLPGINWGCPLLVELLADFEVDYSYKKTYFTDIVSYTVFLPDIWSDSCNVKHEMYYSNGDTFVKIGGFLLPYGTVVRTKKIYYHIRDLNTGALLYTGIKDSDKNIQVTPRPSVSIPVDVSYSIPWIGGESSCIGLYGDYWMEMKDRNISMSLWAADLCHVDGFFKRYPSDTSNEIVLCVSIKGVSVKAIKETIKLPDGMSFSNTDVINTKDITVGGTGEDPVVTQYDIYSYECESPGNEVIFEGEVYKKEKLSYKKYNSSVAIQLQDADTGEEIKELIYTMGSFSWDLKPQKVAADGNYVTSFKYDKNTKTYLPFRRIAMTLTISNPVEATGSVIIKLPNGFSFTKDTLKPSIPIILTGEKEQRVGQYIYPLYSRNYEEHFKVQLTGMIKAEVSIPIVKNVDAGKIKMRATRSITNKKPGNMFMETINLYPDTDFYTSTTAYNGRLAMLGCTLSQAVYNLDGKENYSPHYIYYSLNNLGFSSLVWFPSNGNHDVAIGIADKIITSPGGEIKHILMVAVRGTVGTEWIGNFNVGKSEDGLHDDFNKCKNKILRCIDEYCGNSYPKDKARIFICAHSRAAAAAALAAHELNKNGGFKELSCYNFATPNHVKKTQIEKGVDNNIFNYCYKYDVVTAVPGSGYGKYGRTYYVGGTSSRNAPEAVQADFNKYTGGNDYRAKDVGWDEAGLNRIYFGYMLLNSKGKVNEVVTYLQKAGWFVAHAPTLEGALARGHGGENYCAWVKNHDNEPFSDDNWENKRGSTPKLMDMV